MLANPTYILCLAEEHKMPWGVGISEAGDPVCGAAFATADRGTFLSAEKGFKSGFLDSFDFAATGRAGAGLAGVGCFVSAGLAGVDERGITRAEEGSLVPEEGSSKLSESSDAIGAAG